MTVPTVMNAVPQAIWVAVPLLLVGAFVVGVLFLSTGRLLRGPATRFLSR